MIEEDALVRKLLEKRLQAAGWTVTALRDADHLIPVLQGSPADLILLDLAPPDMHGLETIERIRSQGISTPILVLTTFEPPHLHAIVLGNGGNDLVRKPYDQEHLIERMQRLVAA